MNGGDRLFALLIGVDIDNIFAIITLCDAGVEACLRSSRGRERGARSEVAREKTQVSVRPIHFSFVRRRVPKFENGFY